MGKEIHGEMGVVWSMGCLIFVLGSWAPIGKEGGDWGRGGDVVSDICGRASKGEG